MSPKFKITEKIDKKIRYDMPTLSLFTRSKTPILIEMGVSDVVLPCIRSLYRTNKLLCLFAICLFQGSTSTGVFLKSTDKYHLTKVTLKLKENPK